MRRSTRTLILASLFCIVLPLTAANKARFLVDYAGAEAPLPIPQQDSLRRFLDDEVPFCEVLLSEFPNFPVEEQKRHYVFDFDHLCQRLAKKFPEIARDEIERSFGWKSSKWFPGRVYFAYFVKDAEGEVKVDEAARLVPLEAARIVAERLNSTFGEKVQAVKEDLDRKAQAARKVEEQLRNLTSSFGIPDLCAEDERIAERIASLQASLFECNLREAEVAARRGVLRREAEQTPLPAPEENREKSPSQTETEQQREANLLVFVTARIMPLSVEEVESNKLEDRVRIEMRCVELLPVSSPGSNPVNELFSPLFSSPRSRKKPVPPGEGPNEHPDKSRNRLARHFFRPFPPIADEDQMFPLTGIMTDRDFRLVWRGVSEIKSSRVLTRDATVRSGERTILKAVREVTYFGPRGKSAVEEGLILEVTPSISRAALPTSLSEPPPFARKDRRMALVLTPEFTRIVGWKKTADGERVLREPIIAKRNVTTTVHIEDGETMVFAGRGFGLQTPALMPAQEAHQRKELTEVSAAIAKLEADAAGIKARKDLLEAEIERLQERQKRIATVLPEYQKLKKELAAREELAREARKKYIQANDALETSRPRIIEHLPTESDEQRKNVD